MKISKSLTQAFAGLTAATFLLLPVAAWAEEREYYHGPGMMWGGGWGGWFMGPLMMLLFIALAVVMVVFLVRWLGSHGAGLGGSEGTTQSAPFDILKERFARGEIDQEEFERRKRVLEE